MESAGLSNVKDRATRLFVTLKGNVRDGFAAVTETLRQKAAGSRGPSVKELTRDKASVVHAGFLRKRSSQLIQKHYKWKYFFVVIAHEHVYYYKDEFSDHPSGSFSLSGYIDARTAVPDVVDDVLLPDRVKKSDSDNESDSENVPYAFVVIPQDPDLKKMQRFAAQSEEECKVWMGKIKAAIKEAREKLSQSCLTLPLSGSSRVSQEKSSVDSNPRSSTLGRVYKDKVITASPEKEVTSDNESDPEDYLDLDEVYLQPSTRGASNNNGSCEKFKIAADDSEDPGGLVSTVKSMTLPPRFVAASSSAPPALPPPARAAALVPPVLSPARRPLPEVPAGGVPIPRDIQSNEPQLSSQHNRGPRVGETVQGHIDAENSSTSTTSATAACTGGAVPSNDPASAGKSEMKVAPILENASATVRRLPPPPLHAPPTVSATVLRTDMAGPVAGGCVPEAEVKHQSLKPTVADRAPAPPTKSFLGLVSDKTSSAPVALGRSSTSTTAHLTPESGGELVARNGAHRPSVSGGSADESHQPKAVRLPVGAINVMLPLGDRGKSATLPCTPSNPAEKPAVLVRPSPDNVQRLVDMRHLKPVEGGDNARVSSGVATGANNQGALQNPKASELTVSPRLMSKCLVTDSDDSTRAALAAMTANSKPILHYSPATTPKISSLANESGTHNTCAPCSPQSPRSQPKNIRQFPPPPTVQVNDDPIPRSTQKTMTSVTSIQGTKAMSPLPLYREEKLLKPAAVNGPGVSSKPPRHFPPPPSPRQQEKNSHAAVQAPANVRCSISSTYYWGSAKDEANKALKERRSEDGIFLIRDSSDPTTKVLCVTALDQIHSLKIYQRSHPADSATWSFSPDSEGGGSGVGDGGGFQSIDDLVANHLREPILIRGGTVALKLKRSLTRDS